MLTFSTTFSRFSLVKHLKLPKILSDRALRVGWPRSKLKMDNSKGKLILFILHFFRVRVLLRLCRNITISQKHKAREHKKSVCRWRTKMSRFCTFENQECALFCHEIIQFIDAFWRCRKLESKLLNPRGCRTRKNNKSALFWESISVNNHHQKKCLP